MKYRYLNKAILMLYHVNKDQLSELKVLLDSRYKELIDDIRQHLVSSNEERYIQIAGKVHDLADESVADLLSDLKYLTIEHLVTELREVENAINRVKTGTYGVCCDCEDEIVYARLKAYPSAIRCVNCQEKFEKKAERSNAHKI